LPKTGSATGTTAHVLSALLLVLLGGLLLRRARTRG
jgi:LPXTG-motif cell wall-anchored protein